MSFSPQKLVIGISSRALFDMDDSHNIFKKERGFADKRPAPTGGPWRTSEPPNLGLRHVFLLRTKFSETARIEGFCIEALIRNRRARFLKPVFHAAAARAEIIRSRWRLS